MEPQISDTKAKPMRYASFLSFLENFIFVPYEPIQVWWLKFLISTAFLIIAVAVVILCYPDDLCEAKRIEGPLDSCTKDFCKSRLPEVNYSGFNHHQISLPEHNTGKVESVVYLTFCPNRSDPIRRSKCCFSGPVDFSRPYTQHTVDQLVFSVAEQKFITVVGDISVISNILGPNQSRTPISRAGLEFQSTIIGRHGRRLDEHESTPAQVNLLNILGPNRSDPIRRSKCSSSGPVAVKFSSPYTQDTQLFFSVAEQEYNTFADDISVIGKILGPNKSDRVGQLRRLDEHESTPAQVSLLNILGPNQSDPVWQLRLLAALSLVVHATMGVLILPGDLQGVHATYQRVMLITSFGVPIAVAVITLLVSIWLVPGPSGRSNWITGLSVANFSLLGGRLAVYWTIKRGTENILRGEEIELMREVI